MRNPAESDRPQPLEPAATGPGLESVAPEGLGRFGMLAASRPWSKPLVIVVGILAGLFLVARIAAALPSRQFGRLICLAFVMGIIIFGYKSYAEQMMGNYLKVKGRILSLFKKGSEREEGGVKKEIGLVSDPTAGR